MSSFIKDAAHRLFSGEVNKQLITSVESGAFPADLWAQVVESGFTRLFRGEDEGGIEAEWIDVYDLFHALGYHQVPAPVAETAIAHLLLAKAGVALDVDTPIALGSATSASSLRLDAGGPAARLSGQLNAVKWARHSSHALVATAAPTRQLLLVALDADAVNIMPRKDISGMPADLVVFDRAPVLACIDAPFSDLKDPLQTLGAGARAMMMVGALEFILDQSVQYAKDRVQFGKPIGKNQAIQQQLAALAGELALAYATAQTAARDLPGLHAQRSPNALFSVATAKINAGEAANTGAGIAHQVHGAIGFTYEHQLNFATRRLWAWRSDFGSTSWWARELGSAYAQAGGDAFWANLVDRVIPA